MYRKGSAMERELIELLWSAGFACIRSAGSGKTRHPNPDILASNSRAIYAIECKSTSKKEIRIKAAQIDELVSFSHFFNAVPVVAARFNHAPWFFLTIEMLERLPSGNMKVTLEHAKRNAFSFDAFFRDH